MVACRNCSTLWKDAQDNYPDTDNKRYFFETMYGDYCCQNDECVWEYIMEHTIYEGEHEDE